MADFQRRAVISVVSGIQLAIVISVFVLDHHRSRGSSIRRAIGASVLPLIAIFIALFNLPWNFIRQFQYRRSRWLDFILGLFAIWSCVPSDDAGPGHKIVFLVSCSYMLWGFCAECGFQTKNDMGFSLTTTGIAVQKGLKLGHFWVVIPQSMSLAFYVCVWMMRLKVESNEPNLEEAEYADMVRFIKDSYQALCLDYVAKEQEFNEQMKNLGQSNLDLEKGENLLMRQKSGLNKTIDYLKQQMEEKVGDDEKQIQMLTDQVKKMQAVMRWKDIAAKDKYERLGRRMVVAENAKETVITRAAISIVCLQRRIKTLEKTLEGKTRPKTKTD